MTKIAVEKKDLNTLLGDIWKRIVKGKIDIQQNELIRFFRSVKEIYGKGYEYEIIIPLELLKNQNEKPKRYIKLGAIYLDKDFYSKLNNQVEENNNETDKKVYCYMTQIFDKNKLLNKETPAYSTNFSISSTKLVTELVALNFINKEEFRVKREKLEGVDLDEIKSKLDSWELKKIPEIVREFAAFNKQIKDQDLRDAVDKARSIIFNAKLEQQTDFYKQFIQDSQNYIKIIYAVVNSTERTPHGSTYKDKFANLCNKFTKPEDVISELYVKLVEAAKLYDPHFIKHNEENYDEKASFESYLFSKTKSNLDDLEYSSRSINSYWVRVPNRYKSISWYVMSAFKQWEELDKENLPETEENTKEAWILQRANEMYFENNKVRPKKDEWITLDKMRDVMNLEYGFLSFNGKDQDSWDDYSNDSLENTIASERYEDDMNPEVAFKIQERKEVLETITSEFTDDELMFLQWTLELKELDFTSLRKLFVKQFKGEDSSVKINDSEKKELIELLINVRYKYLNWLRNFVESKKFYAWMEKVYKKINDWESFVRLNSNSSFKNPEDKKLNIYLYILWLEYGWKETWDWIHMVEYINNQFNLQWTRKKARDKLKVISSEIALLEEQNQFTKKRTIN